MKPKIGLVGFERFQGEIFAENGLAVSGHIFTGKDNGTEANATRNISFERFKKFDYPGQPETSSESDLLAFGTSQQSAEAFEYFVRCVERWDWSKELVHDWTDYRHLFAKALANANAWLEATKPEVLVFSNVPHQGALIALFYLARQKGIRTIIFLQSHFPGRSWAFEHWDDIGKSKTLLNEETFEIDISPPDAPPFYMKSVRSDLKRNIRAIASEARARFVVFSGLTGLTSTSRRQTRNRNLGRIKKEAENRHYYQTANTFFSKKLDAVSAGGFVYFPLHLQPEMTTDVLGGAYADQALALETLRKLCQQRSRSL